jgi:tRNA (guanine-N7-)-methyltransferase
MSRHKLKKFAENEARSNIIQPGKPLFEQIKGNWRAYYFKNDRPLILELGCGRGEYTVGMARLHSDQNYVGVDIKGDRIWKGSKTAEQESLGNVAFLRTQVQSLEDFFGTGEADEIWLTFPDPRPKKSDLKRRMTHPRFMEIYRSILRPGGRLHLKTDNDILFEFTLEVLSSLKGVAELQFSRDLYRSELLGPELQIKTHYENLFAEQGFTIKYLTFLLGN